MKSSLSILVVKVKKKKKQLLLSHLKSLSLLSISLVHSLVHSLFSFRNKQRVRIKHIVSIIIVRKRKKGKKKTIW